MLVAKHRFACALDAKANRLFGMPLVLDDLPWRLPHAIEQQAGFPTLMENYPLLRRQRSARKTSDLLVTEGYGRGHSLLIKPC